MMGESPLGERLGSFLGWVNTPLPGELRFFKEFALTKLDFPLKIHLLRFRANGRRPPARIQGPGFRKNPSPLMTLLQPEFLNFCFRKDN